MPLRKKTLILRLFFTLLIISGCAVTIYYWFFMRLVRVPTSSMMNTIIPGDRLLIQKLLGQIERGEIVMYRYPNDSDYYICRVVGLPGETIHVRGTTVYINERPLDEQRVLAQEDSELLNPLKEISTEGNGPYRVYYIRHVRDESSDSPADFGVNSPFKIPNNSYFLLGDNRHNSHDSRYRGAVPGELIWGEVALVYYSEAETPDGSIRWERIFKKVR